MTSTSKQKNIAKKFAINDSYKPWQNKYPVNLTYNEVDNLLGFKWAYFLLEPLISVLVQIYLIYTSRQ